MNSDASVPVMKKRRFGAGMPHDFSRGTPLSRQWRWISSICLALSVIPVALTLSLGWVFIIRVVAVCAFGGLKPRGLVLRIALLAVDLMFLMWWLLGGYPQSLPEVALAVFVLGVSFKAMELRRVGDGYMASVMCFLGPFLAAIHSLPWWVVLLSVFSMPAAMMLRSGLSCIEASVAPGMPWHKRHWRPVIGLTLMAIPFALMAFWLLPRLETPWLGGQKVGRTGMSDTMQPGSMDGMLRDPTTAMMVSFTKGRPELPNIYWRAATLSVFDGRTWSPLPLPPSAEDLPSSSQSASYAYAMTLYPQPSNFVPFMDRPLSVSGNRVISTYTLTHVAVDSPSTSQQYFGVSSPDAVWAPDSLSDQALRANLQMPREFNPKTVALIKEWEKAGYQGEAMVARALDYFKTEMTYSYTPPLLGKHSVDELLFDTKEGFCEHFSSSFTFMMRAAGIPSRIVTGYQGGRWSGSRQLEVRQLDAHAWSEVWIEGRGWVRIDPTFAVVKKRPPPPGEASSRGFNFGLSSWAISGASRWIGGFDSHRQKDMFSNWSMDSVMHWLVLLGVLALLVLWTFSAFWWEWRPRQAQKEILYFEKLRRSILAMTHQDVSATPRQMATAIKPYVNEEGCSALAAVLLEWESWRYGGEENPALAQKLKEAHKKIKVWRIRR